MILSRSKTLSVKAMVGGLSTPLTLRRVGVPKEIKQHEYRVSMTPAGVKTLINRDVMYL